MAEECFLVRAEGKVVLWMVEEDLSYGLCRKGCLVDDGGRVVLWMLEEVLSCGCWRKGCLVDAGGRAVLSPGREWLTR